MKFIYHITTKSSWQLAQQIGYYEDKSLAIEGFIHCSTANQVEAVLQRYFAAQKDLLKLIINVEKLQHKLVYELAPSINENFPHVYGIINLDAIEAVEEL